MKKRIRLTLAAALTAVAIMAASAGNAFAIANPDNNGKAENAPGQQTAGENCSGVVNKQEEKGVAAGGGPKEDIPAPTNCDHFFQNS
jgi:hypothetical protein